MERIEALVFDFDGTLAELTLDFALMRRRVSALVQGLLEEEDLVCPPDTPALEWLDQMAGDLREEDPDLALEMASRGRLVITAMEMDAAREGRLFPFTRDLLDDLAARGLKLGVVTRNCTAAVRAVFPDLGRYCPVVLAREDVARVKPHPDHLMTALARLQTAPARALMIGDHPLDIETARRAGTLSAGVASGHASQEALAQAGPDFVARDCRELAELLAARGLIPERTA
jgi:phosphoglycolate phosphatase